MILKGASPLLKRVFTRGTTEEIFCLETCSQGPQTVLLRAGTLKLNIDTGFEDRSQQTKTGTLPIQ